MCANNRCYKLVTCTLTVQQERQTLANEPPGVNTLIIPSGINTIPTDCIQPAKNHKNHTSS